MNLDPHVEHLDTRIAIPQWYTNNFLINIKRKFIKLQVVGATTFFENTSIRVMIMKSVQ